ncbi:peptidase S24 [Leptospira hartskeerlii]|uniref:Peptidase S24 n=1 Tax=Leptospira hartskeerlii TaxID=2023177 RepID=A0A2M9X8T6_9LEPT|nr:S24 family peptidase [Leptospira hartskeerlii]PJZ23962.1 peptidase S24 [Leptospira hartskeerlii]PJZ35226.1 peptidase S24 [Leptospira hartskeerlii]
MSQAQIKIERSTVKIPLLRTRLTAGFPKPSDDYFQKRLDPKDLLEINPATTFYMRISGDTWNEYGIFDGDHVVIDRSIPPSNGKIAVVTYAGNFTLRRIGKIGDRFCFLVKDQNSNLIPIEPDSEVEIWGIISFGIHRF